MFSEMAPEGAAASASRWAWPLSEARAPLAAAAVRARSTGAVDASLPELLEKMPDLVQSHHATATMRRTRITRDNFMARILRPSDGAILRRRDRLLVRFDRRADRDLGLFGDLGVLADRGQAEPFRFSLAVPEAPADPGALADPDRLVHDRPLHAGSRADHRVGQHDRLPQDRV